MNRAASDDYDIAIIGAGINGAGIARDAALRGLRVLIVDQNDLCSSTSAISSRLIHGGLRYLEYAEFPLVFESLRERITLRKIAQHLVTPIRITIPIYADARRGPWLVRLGMWLYDLLSIGKTVPGHDRLGRAAALRETPGLRDEGLLSVVRYFDAQVTWSERLVLENLLAAQAASAEVRTYTEVTGILTGDLNGNPRVRGLRLRDRLTGEDCEITATTVINAAGPWVDRVLDTLLDAHQPLIGGTKGSHIVVGAFAGAPADAFYVEAAADGRPFFIIPWAGQYLIGTTDIRFDGDLGDVRAGQEEIDYLLAETNLVFPNASLTQADIHFAYAGVRPLPRREKGPEAAITRRHIIADSDAFDGLINIIGGKLTTFRNLAEQTIDRVARQRRQRLPASRTADVRLPGANRLAAAKTALEDCALSEAVVERLMSVYGGRALEIAALIKMDSSLARTLDADGTVIAAEVPFVIRGEFPRTLTDIVFRRLMVGLSADQGRGAYADIAALAADEFDWSDAETAQQLAELEAYSAAWRV